MRPGLRVLLRIRVAEGQEERFEELWRAHAETVRSFTDNHGQQLLRTRGERGSYTVLTDWTDEPSFRAFERSPEQQAYLRELWAIRSGGEMQLLDLVHTLSPATPAEA
ncbi:antibiotic biosynthesis monooxygenase family protein [Streptomyces albidoflavus]|uniref:Putative monooxygenase n=1 Tax=Streptomyces griseus TaxID=1911 RepID=Q2MGC7_STRGR|nr:MULTISPECIES: antibiotic biosynthesis monooxygenase family protein [Streptomyces]AAQ08920.1 putative monooxygenase [Streptomyces griseus]SCD85032.1 Heme-degrading monooxygenase HmoA [Streptomyces sp. IgraMP-1]MCM3817651.1 antibiotic biosynthesis monooxygenase [Streptomyces sp. DR3-1]MCU7704434.1 antibiotic biosynthesis monooxygenase [Streptomyces albidoflavus]MCX5457560.1 antibiotic biosynthesis monooxygenase [Streptomyces sp. FT1]